MTQPVTDIMVLFGDKQIPLKTVLRSFVAELVPVLRSELENPNEVISQNKAYKQFGNSVVVPLMTNVAHLVVNKMQMMDAETNSGFTNCRPGF